MVTARMVDSLKFAGGLAIILGLYCWFVLPNTPPNKEAKEKLAWLGYKGGSLPAVLTVVYYAQPWHTTEPVAVALFFHDLPLETYRQWRRTLPHDELARWLLYEREAIPLVREMLATAD